MYLAVMALIAIAVVAIVLILEHRGAPQTIECEYGAPHAPVLMIRIDRQGGPQEQLLAVRTSVVALTGRSARATGACPGGLCEPRLRLEAKGLSRCLCL
jgi:hypothetical protein